MAEQKRRQDRQYQPRLQHHEREGSKRNGQRCLNGKVCHMAQRNLHFGAN